LAPGRSVSVTPAVERALSFAKTPGGATVTRTLALRTPSSDSMSRASTPERARS
jgi:hypothetical protein